MKWSKDNWCLTNWLQHLISVACSSSRPVCYLWITLWVLGSAMWTGVMHMPKTLLLWCQTWWFSWRPSSIATKNSRWAVTQEQLCTRRAVAALKLQNKCKLLQEFNAQLIPEKTFLCPRTGCGLLFLSSLNMVFSLKEWPWSQYSTEIE